MSPDSPVRYSSTSKLSLVYAVLQAALIAWLLGGFIGVGAALGHFVVQTLVVSMRVELDRASGSVRVVNMVRRRSISVADIAMVVPTMFGLEIWLKDGTSVRAAGVRKRFMRMWDGDWALDELVRDLESSSGRRLAVRNA